MNNNLNYEVVAEDCRRAVQENVSNRAHPSTSRHVHRLDPTIEGTDVDLQGQQDHL